jgi:hypothetical protein
MATKRSIPTNLFANPDFFELNSDTTQLIMIGLILDWEEWQTLSKPPPSKYPAPPCMKGTDVYQDADVVPR